LWLLACSVVDGELSMLQNPSSNNNIVKVGLDISNNPKCNYTGKV